MHTQNPIIKEHRRIGRPCVDHSKTPCTKCGGKRDRANSRCLKCLAEHKRTVRARDPERFRRLQRAWHKRNPDKIKRYARTNYLKNKPRYFAQAKKWRLANPKKWSKIMAFQNAKRRSRKLANGGEGFTVDHWKELLRRANGICVYCLKEKANSVDHFIPLKIGGRDDFRNIVPSCTRCNSTKRESHPIPWVLKKFGPDRLINIRAIMFR